MYTFLKGWQNNHPQKYEVQKHFYVKKMVYDDQKYQN